ncbi:HIRAN domain-containing protein [Thermoleophilum album]|uniref:HIRAN domain-containing protein n=1 Tax=Thermoleophilum album TaxID=29539 RepID=A0A1H6FZS7_THEAL|nr:HIRAN domain-containing protein [Thermoleophilum album]SEH16317.1 HIRAN domain-containing protein [Thermoleophilum album]
MGFLRRLLGSKDPPWLKRIPGALQISATLSEGRFRVEVVGESRYQEALEAIAGGRTEEGADLETVALLVPEPTNRYDPNAVQVMIDGKVVGYLSRENAEVLQPRILEMVRRTRRAVACRARVVGGWNRGRGDRGHFGVRLYVDPADFDLEADELDGRWEEPEAHTGRKRGTGGRETGSGPGFLDGRHFTGYVDEVRRLRREGRDGEAESLLLRLVDAVEAEAAAEGWGVASWYYEQLAIIYRKRKDFDAEVRILERFARQRHAPGASPAKLLERLEKARALRDPR